MWQLFLFLGLVFCGRFVDISNAIDLTSGLQLNNLAQKLSVVVNDASVMKRSIVQYLSVAFDDLQKDDLEEKDALIDLLYHLVFSGPEPTNVDVEALKYCNPAVILAFDQYFSQSHFNLSVQDLRDANYDFHALYDYLLDVLEDENESFERKAIVLRKLNVLNPPDYIIERLSKEETLKVIDSYLTNYALATLWHLIGVIEFRMLFSATPSGLLWRISIKNKLLRNDFELKDLKLFSKEHQIHTVVMEMLENGNPKASFLYANCMKVLLSNTDYIELTKKHAGFERILQKFEDIKFVNEIDLVWKVLSAIKPERGNRLERWTNTAIILNHGNDGKYATIRSVGFEKIMSSLNEVLLKSSNSEHEVSAVIFLFYLLQKEPLQVTSKISNDLVKKLMRTLNEPRAIKLFDELRNNFEKLIFAAAGVLDRNPLEKSLKTRLFTMDVYMINFANHIDKRDTIRILGYLKENGDETVKSRIENLWRTYANSLEST